MGVFVDYNQRLAINIQARFVPGQQFTGGKPAIGRRVGCSTLATSKPVVLTHSRATIPLKTVKNQLSRGAHRI